jgi:hypothetical protein
MDLKKGPEESMIFRSLKKYPLIASDPVRESLDTLDSVLCSLVVVGAMVRNKAPSSEGAFFVFTVRPCSRTMKTFD